MIFPSSSTMIWSAFSIEETRCAMMIFVVSGISSRNAFRISASVLYLPHLWSHPESGSSVFQKCPCNTQTLLLSAGNIVSALYDHRMITCRKFFYEAICLCKFADSLNLFLTGMFISPTDIIVDRSCKENVFCNTIDT